MDGKQKSQLFFLFVCFCLRLCCPSWRKTDWRPNKMWVFWLFSSSGHKCCTGLTQFSLRWHKNTLACCYYVHVWRQYTALLTLRCFKSLSWVQTIYISYFIGALASPRPVDEVIWYSYLSRCHRVHWFLPELWEEEGPAVFPAAAYHPPAREAPGDTPLVSARHGLQIHSQQTTSS